ncbi:uncharacterized protein LOC107640851 [Arachis ipaensis]|uniref:uncharacterized protein LOC107640851 n=1 Tax=Arachis ipaensis TaxID=130454 RepID=UPI0007AF882E|nr:uncharacterized protein LOC107640851 [Arachis ipaensis]
MEANAAATLQAAQRLGQPARNGDENGDDLGGAPMTLATFLKVHPPTFRGLTNPTETDNCFWKRPRIGGGQNATCFNFKTPMFLGKVFRKAFYKKYFLESAREAKEIKLLQLKQGSLLVADYTSRFEELCRFSRACQGAPETYESWKCVQYQRGLKDDIMTAVAPMEIRIFSDLVNKARVVEEYAKTVASSGDTHGGNTSRERGDYLGDRTSRDLVKGSGQGLTPLI